MREDVVVRLQFSKLARLASHLARVEGFSDSVRLHSQRNRYHPRPALPAACTHATKVAGLVRKTTSMTCPIPDAIMVEITPAQSGAFLCVAA